MLARVGRFDPQQLLHLSLSNGSTLCIPYFLISSVIRVIVKDSDQTIELKFNERTDGSPSPFYIGHGLSIYPLSMTISNSQDRLNLGQDLSVASGVGVHPVAGPTLPRDNRTE